MDLCRSGSCCPSAMVDETGVTVIIPLDDVEIQKGPKGDFVEIRLTKEQIDRATVLMRKMSA